MWIIYDLLFLLVFILSFPVYLLRGKLHRGILTRFGVPFLRTKLRYDLWFHMVSVGETKMMQGLVKEIQHSFPEKNLILTTVTPTGNYLAQRMARPQDYVSYLPFDFSCITNLVIKKIKPKLFVLAETEIWPNLIRSLSQYKIPVIVINGRISDFSFRGYRLLRFLFLPIFRKVSFFAVQTPTDRDRLCKLGVALEKIAVTGNMKFDSALEIGEKNIQREKLNLKDGEILIVAGSTHTGEEEKLFLAYRNLLLDYPLVRLLVAPRHPQRSQMIQRMASKFNFRAVLLSNWDKNKEEAKNPIFVLDSIGQLTGYYAIADVVFVGGSLVKRGGHNILEPAFFAKPVVIGPHMFNFRDISELFLKEKAVLQVDDTKGLYFAFKQLVENSSLRENLGNKAKGLILKNRGAQARNLEIIKSFLLGSKIEDEKR